MATQVQLFLNWRTIPSGIAWGDEVHRTQPDANTFRVSAVPSFHFEPCDDGAGGTTTPPPTEVPRGQLDALQRWPDTFTGLHFQVQVEQLANVMHGIPENYQTNNSFAANPMPKPTPAEIALGVALIA